ncbi:MAG: O-antigen ligase family protein [Rickettsiaceae bacterium]|nr:O-antigen ligase family protein [Rickettsiaceae bacterium]
MLSGLFASPVAIILFSLILINNFDKIDFKQIYKKKLEITFFSWLLISCIWSLAGIDAFTKFLSIIYIAFGVSFITQKNWCKDVDLEKTFFIPLVLGGIVAILLFIVEYMTEGSISLSFRNIFQNSNRHHFAMHFLDRGCSVLSMLSWPIIYFLIKKRYFILSAIYFGCVCYALSISDSLASYLAFILGAGVFAMTCIIRSFAAYVMIALVIFMAATLPIFSSMQSPRDLSDKYYQAPDSGKHRLFIWKFTATKALEKPVFGWGFNSSQDIPVDEEVDVIYFHQYKWYPLPLHPHNNFMQIWIECGVVGLVLFALMLVKLIFRVKKVYAKKHNLLWLSSALGCFMNYLFISMISYGLWQMWWVSVSAMTLILFDLLAHLGRKGVEQEL